MPTRSSPSSSPTIGTRERWPTATTAPTSRSGSRTGSSRGSSTRSATCSRSRASWSSRPSRTTRQPTRSPIGPRRGGGVSRRRPAQDPRRRRGDQRQDPRTCHDRTHGLLRPAARPRSRRRSWSCCGCPGVGPKTVRVLYETLGIENLEDLRHAAEAGHLRNVRGLSEKTEASILEGIAALEANPRRMLLGPVEALVETLIGRAVGRAGRRVDPAGRLVPATARDDRRHGSPGGDHAARAVAGPFRRARIGGPRHRGRRAQGGGQAVPRARRWT